MNVSPPRQLLINNQWLATAARLAVVNPFSGEEIATVSMGGRDVIEQGIAAAHAAYTRVRSTPAHARATLLLKVAAGIEQRREEFAATIVAEAGKPITFAEAEVARAVMTFTIAAEEARRQHGELLDIDGLPAGDGHFGLARRFPIGVIAAITPFNFPLNLVAHKVAPCLATGNTMVVKPAMKTPLTALLLAEVLVEAGMPAGQVNFVTCSNEDAALLISDERVKKVTFTGSPLVGWMLKERCGKKKITLELGGNAAVIVHADADLDDRHSRHRQRCLWPGRAKLHQCPAHPCSRIAIRRISRTLQSAHHGKSASGRSADRANIVGPMITPEALDQVKTKIDEAVRAGAQLICGGEIRGRCLDATVLEEVDPTLAICAEEAFAPVATLHRYTDIGAALHAVNDSVFGLQAGVFTNDLQLAMRAFAELEVGAVLINQVPTFRVESMPYGGVKDSGFGREGVRWAMEEMTELRSLILRLG